jgi:uncharacterized protein
MKNAIWIMLGLITSSLLTSSGFSRDVSDEGKFFSPEGEKKANQTIAQFKSKYNKDIVVETFPSIPEDKKSQYSPDKKNEFFNNWLRERAQALKVDGIYILITRDPAHLQVGIGSQTARLGFTRQDRDKVRDVLVDRFKKKEYDQGLNDAVSMISNRFAEITRGRIAAAPARGGGASGGAGGGGGPAKSSNPAGLSWFSWLIIGIIGLLIMRFILRSFQRMAYGGPRPPYGPGGPGAPGPGASGGGYGGGYPPPGGGGGGYPPPSGGGGGGFFTSLLGGLFGGAAGNWLGSKFGGGSQEAQPGGRQFGATGDEGGGGYDSSSGGDFGGSTGGEPPNGGGGDFGDSGTGDFGGGGGGSGGSDSGTGDF